VTREAHAADDAVAHHDPATHMDAHTEVSDDDHGHAQPRLGPIDWRAWGYAVAGVVVALLVVAVMWAKVSDVMR